MTNLQLRAVLLAAELGSISAAAKALGISQPNASNSIRLLEDEVGFPIFHRSSSGAMLTPKGEAFLPHARQILEENEKIARLRDSQDAYRLRLGGVNYSACIEPFLALCARHRDDPQADLCYSNVSVEEGIAELTKRNLDVVVTPVLKHQVTELISECKKNDIHVSSICKVPAVIFLRKDHPAVLDGRCLDITQGSGAMKDYPYVVYRNLFEDSGATGYNDSDFVQCSYKIYVDEANVRLRVAQVTNAFGFGAQTSKAVMEQHGLTCFPVPGFSLEVLCLTRPADTGRTEVQDYLELLRTELRDILRSH